MAWTDSNATIYSFSMSKQPKIEPEGENRGKRRRLIINFSFDQNGLNKFCDIMLIHKSSGQQDRYSLFNATNTTSSKYKKPTIDSLF